MQHAPRLKGKVIKATRNHYLVKTAGGILTCSLRGKVTVSGEDEPSSVKVGDNVLINRISESEGVIHKILARKSRLSRAVEGKAYKEHIIAVNIDQMIIIMSTQRPEFKSGLLDRYIVIAEKNELSCIICLNKIDLAAPAEFNRFAEAYRRLKYRFIFTSVLNGMGIMELSELMMNKVSVVVGHSGVGKSSLIQKMEPALDLSISEISLKTQKGKHTTSHVELFPLSNKGYIIDTPGIRELGLWDIYRNELKEYFIEFSRFQAACQFNNCMHLKEPGCAVKFAVDEGIIFEERYLNYQNIYQDLRAAPYELLRRR